MMKMEIVNPFAAGIDIGSRSHYVAVGQAIDDIQEFGVTHSEHLKLIAFLKEASITTVAMESTGSYWQSLYYVLIEHNFDVRLIAGSSIKNYKKTDVKDAQSIQKLHTLGLLNSCFLAENLQATLKELSRHRKNLIQDISKATLRMQKCLRMMNFRLDVAVSDIVGKSGMKIIRAIISQELDPEKLAKLADSRVKKSQEEIMDSLHGNPREELMFELKQNFEVYEFYQTQLESLDKKLDEKYQEIKFEHQITEETVLAKKQKKGKNQTKVRVQEYAYKIFGVDLMAIPCVSVNTVLTFISEVGLDFNKFPSSKHFCSWLRLSPNNKITGSKVKSSRTPKGKNALALALRDAANAIGNQKEGPLVNFFKRIGLRKGRGAAVTATARKLATIIYNLVTTKQPYNPIIPDHIKEKILLNKTKKAKELLKELGLYVVDSQGAVIS